LEQNHCLSVVSIFNDAVTIATILKHYLVWLTDSSKAFPQIKTTYVTAGVRGALARVKDYECERCKGLHDDEEEVKYVKLW